ncbi:ABC transporter ATP-binding protein [Sulfidibacter corallicola]|uniref:ABC transporter ATP-binding protein n=1 Tax=Sulfidibacter corallicola TaxID=2818388 RepID=A0A8A4TUL3_SULCO|nr:ABC transporter ATP-binding protein [Sulfidibacter corallicola]QTD52824.1 ABC transporter ATP-binding protein [Sulfidibacter corallicola]
MVEALLTTVNLNKSYVEADRDIPVIRGLNMEVNPGEYLVIMGSSGSGKSSLLYLLGGMDTPSSGSVLVGRSAVEGLNEQERARMRRDRIGFVFQDFNLIPHLTILENILVAGYLLEKPRKRVIERAHQLMSLVGIEKLANRRPAQTSGGEQQRCAIARALINDPDILLADEPTGSLNAAASSSILELFDTIHRAGQTLVLVTHELSAACRGQRVGYIHHGNLEEFHFPPDTSLGDREKVLFSWLSQRGW